MATITTKITIKKEYEFCDDIKKHILSFLAPKRMKLTNLYNIPRYLLSADVVLKAKHTYRLRMLITKEQYDYERSKGGQNHRRKNTLNMLYVTRKTNLIVAIKNYWIKQTNRLGGIDGVYSPEYAYPPSVYNNYIVEYANPYSKLLHAHNFKIVDNKSKYLASIREGGEVFQARAERKRRAEEYECWLVEHHRRRAEQQAEAKAKAKAVKQARSRERVLCEYCKKELARGSLSKHQKTGGKCYEAWKKL